MMNTEANKARLAEERRVAQDVYDRVVVPQLRPEDRGKYVAVAYESGDFEVDDDDYAATERLMTRRPGARLWLMRAGLVTTCQIRKLEPGSGS